MMTKYHVALLAAALMAATGVARAQSTQDHQAHHPAADNAPSAKAPSSTAPPSAMPARPGGMPGGPGTTMGGDMAAMMQRMHGTMPPGGMMGMGPGGMHGLQHIEGVLAYVRTELHISDAQAPRWNAFADAVRSSAASLRQAMAQSTSQANPAPGPVPAPEQMERRIALLSMRLEAMRAVLPPAKALYAVLTEEQAKAADDMMAEHFMMMRRGMR